MENSIAGSACLAGDAAEFRAPLRSGEHGRRAFRLSLLAVLFVGSAESPALSQEQDEQLWLRVRAAVELRDHLDLRLETNQRFSDDRGGLYESQYLAALAFGLSGGVRLIGGINRVVGSRDGRVVNTEWRPRQEVSMRVAKIGPGELAARVRLEQRFRSDDNEVGHRVRPEISFSVPLDRDLELELAHESYFNLNSTGYQDGGHERMRNSLTFSVPIARRLSAQVGYLNQYRFNEDDRDLMEHALTTSVSFDF